MIRTLNQKMSGIFSEWIRFLRRGDEPGSESENESDDLQTTGIPDQDPKPSEIRDKDPRPSGI